MEQTPETMTLEAIETEISAVMKADTLRWTRMAVLINEVKRRELYSPSYRSFSSWMNAMAEKIPCAVSLLWERHKAGQYYAAYESRAQAAGAGVPQLSETRVSAETINLCAKIAGTDTALGDRLVSQAIEGSLSRGQLSDAWEQKKAAGGHVQKSRYDFEDDTDGSGVTEGIMIAALGASRDWLRSVITRDLNRGETDPSEQQYRKLSQVTVTGSGVARRRRMDALIIETSTTWWAQGVHLHAVEIKVSASDLAADAKMGDYADYADYFWLFVPKELQNDAMAYVAPHWGVLVYDENDGKISVAQAAAYRPGQHRAETVERALRRLL